MSSSPVSVGRSTCHDKAPPRISVFASSSYFMDLLFACICDVTQSLLMLTKLIIHELGKSKNDLLLLHLDNYSLCAKFLYKSMF